MSNEINVRVRCTTCEETYVVGIPRSGRVVIVPRDLLCVKCWTPVKILNPKLKHLVGRPKLQ